MTKTYQLIHIPGCEPVKAGDPVRNKVTGLRYTFLGLLEDGDGLYVRVKNKWGDVLALPPGRLLNTQVVES